MKIESRENIKGNIKTTVSVGSKTFVRLQKNFVGPMGTQVVEWRNKKTNCLVKADKHKSLEEQFGVVDMTRELTKKPHAAFHSNVNILASGSTKIHSSFLKEKTEREKMIDNKIIELCEAGSMLMATKYYKETLCIGLKDAKDYVFALWDEVKKEKMLNPHS